MSDWAERISQWNRRRVALRRLRENPSAYARWVERHDTVTPTLETALAARARALASRPLLSLVLPLRPAEAAQAETLWRSVEAQFYADWELVVAPLGPTDAAATPGDRIAGDLPWRGRADRDPRLRLAAAVPGDTAAAIQAGFDACRGEFVALLAPGDRLRPHSLLFVAEALAAEPLADVLYSDEDRLGPWGERTDPRFKPDWNLDLFRSCDLIGQLALYRRSLLLERGGCRPGFDGAEGYDLALRCCETLPPERIVHLPYVLCHRQPAADPAPDAARRALVQHLQRCGVEATVEPAGTGAPTPTSAPTSTAPAAPAHRVRYTLPAVRPTVSLIVPTRDRLELLKACLDSVIARTVYPRYEIILVDNGSTEPATLDYLRVLAAREPRVRVLRDSLPFNFSRLNNLAAATSYADLVCLLNNDVEPVRPDWLHELVSFAVQPDVGAVGARLWYPDRTLQHGGIFFGGGGPGRHAHRHLAEGEPGYLGRAALTQSWSAVTGACLLLRRSVYEQVGGLDEEHLAVAFNDVDLCFKVRELGLRVVWTPYADLIHHESASRGLDDSPAKRARFEAEFDCMRARWPGEFREDPAYNPNLTLDAEDFLLADPPRVSIGEACVPHPGRRPRRAGPADR